LNKFNQEVISTKVTQSSAKLNCSVSFISASHHKLYTKLSICIRNLHLHSFSQFHRVILIFDKLCDFERNNFACLTHSNTSDVTKQRNSV